MNTDIEYLSNIITPKTAGILWLTDNTLNNNSSGVSEINYLLNGLLTKTINNEFSHNKAQNNFFMGESFGNPFFVSHSVIKDGNNLTSTENDINMIKSQMSQSEPIILILNRSKNTANHNILKILSKKFPSIKFENFNI